MTRRLGYVQATIRLRHAETETFKTGRAEALETLTGRM